MDPKSRVGVGGGGAGGGLRPKKKSDPHQFDAGSGQ